MNQKYCVYDQGFPHRVPDIRGKEPPEYTANLIVVGYVNAKSAAHAIEIAKERRMSRWPMVVLEDAA